ncbi:putative bifunctional diguanylate cyclase/phosphodiesterase [Devosia faecipullorum]|uniref:putative bifunctional diguanylate cyclase/phosphodiesterase n=1 Tax=Devosia faecipullorum TaxID=2755039 RepID=UPI00187BA557|nr:EAL domain-containing protein [Devosia faecipullorum]MBE7733630.1 EAL domain-containing protein [Devosia faecipullorum]
MSVRRYIRDLFTRQPDGPELAMAQWRALSRQIPLLYAMLVANTLIVAWTHVHVAPAELTIYIPAVLTFLCVVRTIGWWRSRNAQLSVGQARSRLLAMVWMAAGLAVGFTAWSLSLFPFGDAYMRSQIAFYMGITTIGCMFCLMHVRAAALVVGILVLFPFTLFFITSGQPTFIAIAINMALVITALLIILLGNNKDFAELVESRNAMVQRQLETQRLLDENHRLANIDSLTGLPNRRNFDQRLAAALAEAEITHCPIAVARFDLDDFKSVNQIFGHSTGDRVLIEVARRINALRRPDTFVARLDSNSFALVMQGPVDETSMADCGEKLCAAMRKPFDMPAGPIRLSASAGFAASCPGDTAHSLFDRADYANSAAKRNARGDAVVFLDQHASEITKVRRMEHLLHTAKLDDEIYILLQPQFDVALGVTTGFEALARWRSPVLGEVSPAEFIPMAERTGQICRITQIVLGKALAVSELLPAKMRLSVNLSANDIGSATAIEQIVARVSAHSKPCRLDFEITETAVMRDLDQANRSLLALLNLGARIALDDFGTGHSSLTHVQKLPLHRIKIDRSFVMEVTSDPASRAIVKTMVDLCRNLGISCVFEGIETEQQLEALVSLGGQVMQGYLFGRPMPPEEIEAYLARETKLRQLEARAVG